MTSISLIVIHYGDFDYTNSLLDSLRSHPDRFLIKEVIIVDNGSELSPEKMDLLNQDGLVSSVVCNEETSYASGVNEGAKCASGDYMMVSNNDIEWIQNSSIGPAIEMLENTDVGIVGPQQVFPDGSWQRSFGCYPSVSYAIKSLFFITTAKYALRIARFNLGRQKIVEPEYLDGAFLCIDRDCFNTLNGFNESYQFYVEEVDFSWRARQMGWRSVFEPRARIMHVRGGTSMKRDEIKFSKKLHQSQCQFILNHYGLLSALIYHFIQKVALFERILIYSILAFLFAGRWKHRRDYAKNRYEGISIACFYKGSFTDFLMERI